MSTKQRIGDAELGELKTSNNAVREIIGARLTIADLEADFDNGTLTLRGKAADQTTREKAVTIAGRVAGVQRVEDRLEVGGAGAAPGGAAGARTYTVKSGDTLSAIAQRELGAASRWKEIHQANRDSIANPDKIFPGQVLKVPKT